MNSTRLNRIGWRPQTALTDGLLLAYEDFLKNQQ